MAINAVVGDILYNDYQGWHIVILDRVHEKQIGIRTWYEIFILEENIIHWLDSGELKGYVRL